MYLTGILVVLYSQLPGLQALLLVTQPKLCGIVGDPTNEMVILDQAERTFECHCGCAIIAVDRVSQMTKRHSVFELSALRNKASYTAHGRG